MTTAAESNPVGFRFAIPNRFESIIPSSINDSHYNVAFLVGQFLQVCGKAYTFAITYILFIEEVPRN